MRLIEMMDKKAFKNSGLLEQYVLGLSAPEENKIVESFVAAYPEIREELEAMRRSMELYAREHAIPPPPGLKNKVLQQIDNTSAPAEGNGFLNQLGLGMALVGCLVFGILGLIESQGKEAALRSLAKTQNELSVFQQECQNELAKYRAIAEQSDFIQAPETIKVQLKGSNLIPGAVAVAYWNEKAEKGYLQFGSLPPPPTGKTYQLWADVEGEMINAGLLDYSEEAGLIAVGFIPNAESLNITLEPAGGSLEPSVQFLQANAYL